MVKKTDGNSESDIPSATSGNGSASRDNGPKKKANTATSNASVRRTKQRKKQPAPRKYTVWEFPKKTLEDAIKVAQVIEEKNAGKPLDAATLAKYVGFRQSDDWRFLDIVRAANQYDLVEGSGASATVSLRKTGESIVAPSEPNQRKKALADAFQNVDLFKRVAEFYKGKQIPEDEYFANTLVREFNVPRERIDLFIEVFTKNLSYLKSFAVSSDTLPKRTDIPVSEGAHSRTDSGDSAEETRRGPRQFLDTCFVLMPFGGWHDRYYDEIFRQAISEAGFEPMRADDLFHTGSVMEQIWEQVRKAGVLLAELTGKNANVFYELGLAHALGKPVVFVTGAIEDVPFDLRHLRVIPYDINDPKWSTKLREGITAYLRNVKKNPSAAIPTPFRAIAPESQQVIRAAEAKLDDDSQQ